MENDNIQQDTESVRTEIILAVNCNPEFYTFFGLILFHERLTSSKARLPQCTPTAVMYTLYTTWNPAAAV